MNEREDYLAHHGILGMKWGVRRYQNYDGTLTAAGRAKLAKVDNSERLTRKHTAQAKKILKNDLKKYTKLEATTNDEIRRIERQHKHRKLTKEEYTNITSKLTKQGEEWAKREIESGSMLSKINDGTIKAGRDFFVQTDYNWYGLYSTLDRKVITV